MFQLDLSISLDTFYEIFILQNLVILQFWIQLFFPIP
jgi:hypothetical protein